MMEWNGMEWKVMEWKRMEWNDRIEWSGRDEKGKLLLCLRKKLHSFVSLNFLGSFCIKFLKV